MEQHLIITAILFGYFANLVNAQCDGVNDVSATTESGLVCGKVRTADNGVMYASYRGIPYAEQPIGENRFAELKPKIPWDGYFNASEEGPVCPQYDDLYRNMVDANRLMGEDCIRVNVHVPYVTLNSNGSYVMNTTAKLPIKVVVHGGGFQVGSGNAEVLGPEFLCGKGIIVVTFNYRLNVFGFLSMHTEQIPGNNGLRDILTLLRWVQANAEAFGGDRDSVTLAGQSAGAACVHLVTLSLQSEGLFKNAIIMSGTGIPSFFSASKAYSDYILGLFLTAAGINSTDSDEIFQTLIDMPIADIMYANEVVQGQAGLVSFVPCIESNHTGTIVLEYDPRKLIDMGRGNNCTLMIGFTSDESRFFTNKLITLDILSLIALKPALILAPKYLYELSSNVSTALATQVVDHYFNGTPTLEAYMESCSDTYFKYPGFLLSRLREASGAAPTYVYYYTYKADLNAVKLGLNLTYDGAAHVEDLTFVFHENQLFGNSSYLPGTRDYSVKEWMTSAMVDFVKCSKPSCTDDTVWPPSKNLTYLLIDDPSNITTVSLTKEQIATIEFFDAIEEESGYSV